MLFRSVSVGTSVGVSVGTSVGASVGTSDGVSVGTAVGTSVVRDSEELGRERNGNVRKRDVEVSKSMSPFLFLSFRYSEL